MKSTFPPIATGRTDFRTRVAHTRRSEKGSTVQSLFTWLSLAKTQKPARQLWNCTRSLQVAAAVETAVSQAARNIGLLGRDHLTTGAGLWIIPCRAIHTMGMRFAIDLIYLDRRNRVRKIRHSVPAWRMSLCMNAHSVVELAAGTLALTQIEVDDLLAFRTKEDRSSDEQRAQASAR